MNREVIKIDSNEEEALRQKVEGREDTEAERIKRYLNMPDLSRTEGSPIHELAQRIIDLKEFENFDIVEVPEIVPVAESFDLFDFPADHPARSKSDTYYVDENNILRTHTTISWYYYLNSERAKEKVRNNEPLGVITYGKVYRKDEIDRHHMNIFHQMDGYFLLPKKDGEIVVDDLKNILAQIAQTVFGKDVKYRFNPDTFPYTDPSLEMEIDKDGQGTWIEVLGSGIVKGSVLEKLGVNSADYTGWAFGFGLERLAIISMELPDIRLLWSNDERVEKQLVLGNKYKEVSKFPPVFRDISFIVDKSTFVLNDYFDLIREKGGELIEEVALIDEYENEEKFGAGKKSYTFRITYRHLERTLTNEEVNQIHAEIERATEANFEAVIRVV